MLNGGKNVELRVWRKGDPERDLQFTHVIFRMVERLRAMKRLKHLNLRNVNILAKLGERLGPFDNAKDVIRAAEENGWKIGIDEEELIKFMTGTRKVKGGYEEFPSHFLNRNVISTLRRDIHNRYLATSNQLSLTRFCHGRSVRCDRFGLNM